MKSKEAFERIKKSHSVAMACLGIEDKETEQAIDVIEKDLDRLEKFEKAIDILKDKGVMYIDSLESIETEKRLYDLSKQEYNLLKEVFEDE